MAYSIRVTATVLKSLLDAQTARNDTIVPRPTYTMPIIAIIAAILLFLGSKNLGAHPVPGKEIPKFMGHAVTIAEPKRDAYGEPEGPASVCVEFAPQRQCYAAPKEFGNYPTVTVVQVRKDLSALFFSAQSYGVSGWQIHF